MGCQQRVVGRLHKDPSLPIVGGDSSGVEQNTENICVYVITAHIGILGWGTIMTSTLMPLPCRVRVSWGAVTG
jgi:hypothetical protein